MNSRPNFFSWKAILSIRSEDNSITGIAFTVDEEVGQGTKYFDVKEFGATYAYTIDGETAGEIENETFCADTVTITIKGINIHPGYAKDKMVNSIKTATALIQKLPQNSLSP